MIEAFLVAESSPMERTPLGALTSLGRHPENTVPVVDRSVSKFHAQIQRTPQGDYVVRDLKSRNGTFVGGQRIEEQVLKDAQELVLGSVRFWVQFDRVDATVTGTRASLLDPGSTVSLAAGSRTLVQLTDGDAPSIERSEALAQDRFLPSAQITDLEQLRRDYDKLRVAHELSASLRPDRDVDATLRNLAARIFDLLPADRCAILLMDESGQALEPRVVMRRGGGALLDSMPLSQTGAEDFVGLAQLFADLVDPDVLFDAGRCRPERWQPDLFQCMPQDDEGLGSFFVPDRYDRALNVIVVDGSITDRCMGAVGSAVVFQLGG